MWYVIVSIPDLCLFPYFGMHVHRMLEMSRPLYSRGKFQQNVWKKSKGNCGPFLRS